MTLKIKIDKTGNCTKKAAILIPGVSGNSFSSRWDGLVKSCNENSIALLRIDSWNGEDELSDKTIKEIHHELDFAVERLRKENFEDIYLIGKSFGGAVSLIYFNEFISKKVLWAPVIGFNDVENCTYYLDKKMSTIENLTDIIVSKNYIKSQDNVIRIIHGTSDDVISVDNSLKISENCKNVELVKIDSADHSFRDEKHNRELIEKTLNFF